MTQPPAADDARRRDFLRSLDSMVVADVGGGGGAVNSDERRFEVLRAIVADYVSTHEPVGSKAIVDRHNLGVSSATVRNDMAALEEEGYITQPHTSAGP